MVLSLLESRSSKWSVSTFVVCSRIADASPAPGSWVAGQRGARSTLGPPVVSCERMHGPLGLGLPRSALDRQRCAGAGADKVPLEVSVRIAHSDGSFVPRYIGRSVIDERDGAEDVGAPS